MNEVRIRKQNIHIRKSPCENCASDDHCGNGKSDCVKFRMWFSGEWNRLRRMYGVTKREEGEK